ncbi:MAG: aldehyde dehydrogenase family protein [Wenzhouxiangellaceae bacterium]
MSQIALCNPFTGESVLDTQSEPFEQASERARIGQRASRAWAVLEVAERSAACRRALDYFSRNRDEIARGITREMGKPLAEAGGELDFMLERARAMCDFAESGALAPVGLERWHDDSFQGRIEFRPKGVIYIITPWNYPLFCAINGTISALLAGNAVLLKHTTCPSVGAHFEHAFGTLAGIEGLLQHVMVDFATSARIIEEADIDHVIFTGSVRGGREISASVAKRCHNDLRQPFIQCSLELGSNDAAWIAADADLEHAAHWAVKIGRLHNSGQSCCAVKRLYCHADVHDEFVERATAIMQAEIQGDPMDPATTLGPLFGGRGAVASLAGMIEDAEARGARLVTGGDTHEIGKALFLEPTLLTQCDHDMRVMREETFGPVLPVMALESDEQAAGMVTDTRYGLTSAIFTTSRSRAERYISAMDSGTVYVNRCNFVDARLGWNGRRCSGNGSIALSPLGLQALSGVHSVNIDPEQLA